MRKTKKVKRFLATLFALVLLAGLVPITASAATPYNGQMAPGNYEITSADQLDTLAQIVNGPGYNYEGSTFTLLNDIDMSGRPWTPIGTTPDGATLLPFTGVFDGGGNTISSLTCSGGMFGGLFGLVSGISNYPAEIKNLELTNVNISGASYASGGICAYSTTSFCTFSNCAVNGGSISGSSHVGGIAGYAASASQVSGKSNFNNCYVNADVSASGGWAGGICGRALNSVSISSCYASGTVSGGSSIGGLTGSCGTAGNSVIQNSFALQSAITCTNGARVAGAKNPGDQLSSCYAWQDMAVNGNTVSSADPTSIDGAGITVTQALSGATYSALSWDGGIWTLTDNDKLPYITDFGPVDTALYTYLTALSNDATLTTTIGTVDDAASTITDIPNGTTLAALEAAITPAAGATFETYEADETTVATDLATGYKVIVTAEDGVTTKIYTVTVLAALSNDATLTTTIGTVDDAASTITDIPNGTTLAALEAAITPAAGATFETYEADETTVATDLATGYKVIVTAEDGVTTKIYTVTVLAALSNDATLTTTIGTVDDAASTITDIPNGTTLAALEAAITPAAGATFETYEADETTVATDLATGYKVIVTAEDGVTTKIYTVTVLAALSNDATLTTTIGTVDDAASTITDIPNGTTLAALEAAITPAAGATFETYEADETTVATDLATGYKVIVTAEDGVTTKIYTVTVLAALSNDATLTTTIGTVDDAASTITDIPNGTTLAALEAAITPAAGATFETYEADETTVATDLATGYKVIVTAEDGVTTKIYTVTVLAAGPDTTPPTLTNAHVSSLSTTGAAINFTSDEAGTYYYVVYLATEAAPDAATVKTGASGAAITGANSFGAAGLTASTAYTAYVVVEDAAGNTSAIADIDFTTTATYYPGGTGGGSGDGATTGSATSNTVNPGATSSNGTATAQVSESSLSDTIKYAQENNSGSIVIAPEITGSASTVNVVLPGSSLMEIASQTNADLVLDTPAGSMTIPNNTLASVASQANGGTVTMSLGTADTSALTPQQQSAVGSDPVYDISIMSGGENISSFGGASLTITLPYTLRAGENPAGVSVWYLNDAGELAQMPCTYDAATGTVSFTTDHLSYYVIDYDALAVWVNPYGDVRPTDWFYDAVAFVSADGLFTGTGTSVFSPDTEMTRAMLVTVLYRIEGEPRVSGTSAFTDVKDGVWYADAVVWANANGIVTGYDDGLFGTDDSITREQMAAILYRYAQFKGYDVTAAESLTAYADATDLSDWAGAAMNWANAEGLITGVTSTSLAPSGSATRAQVAMILMRFVENIAG